MQTTITADISAPPERLHSIVSDLGTYSSWLGIVADVETTESVDGDPGPAWLVTLRAKIGPFARSKRLRMTRTSLTDDIVVFERREIDERDHSNWKLTSTVSEGEAGSHLAMDLSYDGRLWDTPLEVLLQSEAADASERLDAYAQSWPTP